MEKGGVCLIYVSTIVMPRAKRMQYWHGKRKTVSTKVRRKFRTTPEKPGPKHKLSIQSELVLVLMKLRVGCPNEYLACCFSISQSTFSDLICTWVKFLAFMLRKMVYWPDKDTIRKTMPTALTKKYPNLRCTLDCSETFIDRSRDLHLQGVTWSDYTHHNTVKHQKDIFRFYLRLGVVGRQTGALCATLGFLILWIHPEACIVCSVTGCVWVDCL